MVFVSTSFGEIKMMITRAKVCMLSVISAHAVRLAVSLGVEIWGGQKLANRSQPFLVQTSPNWWACIEESLQIDKFPSDC